MNWEVGVDRRCGHIFNQEKEKIGNLGGMQLALGLQFCGDSWSNGGAEELGGERRLEQ